MQKIKYSYKINYKVIAPDSIKVVSANLISINKVLDNNAIIKKLEVRHFKTKELIKVKIIILDITIKKCLD